MPRPETVPVAESTESGELDQQHEYSVADLALMPQQDLHSMLLDPELKDDPRRFSEVWAAACLSYRIRKELGAGRPSEEHTLVDTYPMYKIAFNGLRPGIVRQDKPLGISPTMGILRDTKVYGVLNKKEGRGSLSEIERIYARTSSGRASFSDVLLTLWQASKDDQLFHVNPIEPGLKALAGIAFASELAEFREAKLRLPAQLALQGFCANTRVGNDEPLGNFSPGSPHLLMRTLGYAMAEEGLLDNLDPAHPNFITLALIKDYLKYYKESMASYNVGDGSSDTKVKSAVDFSNDFRLFNGLLSYVHDVEAFRGGRHWAATRRSSAWRFIESDAVYRLSDVYREGSNRVLLEAVNFSPERMESEIEKQRHKIESQEMSDSEREKSQTIMMALAGAVAFNTDNPEMLKMANSTNFREHVEPLLLDSLELLAKGKAPISVMQLALVAAYNKSANFSPFTQDYGSIQEDIYSTREAVQRLCSRGPIVRTTEYNRIALAYKIFKAIPKNEPLSRQAYQQFEQAVGKVRKADRYRTLRSIKNPKLKETVELIFSRL